MRSTGRATMGIRSVRWSMGRRAMMRLKGHREIRRLKMLRSGQIRSQRQLLLRVVLVLAGLRPGWPVSWQPVQRFQLLGSNGGSGGRARRWREVIGTRSDDTRRWLRVRADGRVAVRYPVRWAGAVVGRRTAAVIMDRCSTEI